MKNNNHLVIVILISVVSLVLFGLYSSIKYDGVHTKSSIIYNDLVNINNNLDSDGNVVDNQDETINEEDKNNDDEIALGDSITNCAQRGYKCPSGWTVDGSRCVKSEPYTCKQCDGRPSNVCPSGSWSGGCCRTISKTCYNVKYQSAELVCKECNVGYRPAGEKSCVECKVTDLTRNYSRISPGEKFCVTPVYDDPSCVSKQICKEGKYSCSTISISFGGKTAYAAVAGEWVKKPDGVYTNWQPESLTKSFADGLLGMKPTMSCGVCVPNPETKDGGYVCKNVYVRGSCGNYSKPKTYNYCCVDNEYVGVSDHYDSDSVIWASEKLKDNTATFNACDYYYGTSTRHYTVTDVPMEKCVQIRKVEDRCKATNITPAGKAHETAVCEENNSFSFDEGEKCSKDSNYKNTFYTINCSRKVKTSFDYGDDGDNSTIRELYRGQGFKFVINVNTSVKCTAEFNGSIWKSTYNLIVQKLNAVDTNLIKYSEEDAINNTDKFGEYVRKVLKPKKASARNDIFKLANILDELREMVDTYNKYEPSSNYNEAANLQFTYLVNNKKETINNAFDRSVISEGKYVSQYEKVVNLGVKSVTNPKNYVRSNENDPRIVKLSPKNVTFDASKGTITANAKNVVSGGNKVYIDYDTDAPQTITPVNIVVSGLAGNNSSVVNNQCTIKVKDLEILYRPIDISNPFINNEWTPGSNWVNSDFDFRNTIHANIWGLTGCNGKYVNGSWGKCT